MSEPEDIWITEIKASNFKAFEKLYGNLKEPVLAYLWSIVRDQDAIYDILQDTFTTIWMKRDTLDERRTIRGLVFRIARNLAYKHCHKERRTDAYHDHNQPVADPSPETELEFDELRTLVNTWIAALPERQREVFELSRLECLSHTEIADTLDISPKTVNNHLVSALRTLRTHFKAYGITPSMR